MFRIIRLGWLLRRDLHVLWSALRHPARPGWLVPAVVLLGVFSIEPVNFAMPPLGLLDDFVVLPLVLHFILKLLPREIGLPSRERQCAST